MIQPILTSDESGMTCILQRQQSMVLVTYNFETQAVHTLYETTEQITSFAELKEAYIVLQNEQLVQISKATLQSTVVGQAQQIQQFQPSGFVYVHNGECFEVKGDTETNIGQIECLYKTVGAFYMYKKDSSVFYRLDGQSYELILDFELESAALSFDGQYIAMFGQQFGMRQLFVYDIEQQIVQNMTETLGEAIGFNANPYSVEAPSWTETNAFYFLVNANEEVRLYYGDLYGTLLPASPEEERIYAYTVAKSGNWAVTASITIENMNKYTQLDITTGIELEIDLCH